MEGGGQRAGGEQPDKKREIMTVGYKDTAVSFFFLLLFQKIFIFILSDPPHSAAVCFCSVRGKCGL